MWLDHFIIGYSLSIKLTKRQVSSAIASWLLIIFLFVSIWKTKNRGGKDKTNMKGREIIYLFRRKEIKYIKGENQRYWMITGFIFHAIFLKIHSTFSLLVCFLIVIFLYVIWVQVDGELLQGNGIEGSSGIGSYLGWAMAAIYLGGRLPQICLNVSLTF